jgi:hypothetical protein
MDRRLALTMTLALVVVGVVLLLLFHPWNRDQESTFRIVGYACKAGFEASVAPSAPDGYVCVRD